MISGANVRDDGNNNNNNKSVPLSAPDTARGEEVLDSVRYAAPPLDEADRQRCLANFHDVGGQEVARPAPRQALLRWLRGKAGDWSDWHTMDFESVSGQVGSRAKR